MAAPKGNKNSLGNSGGKTLNDRKLAADVRKIALTEIKKILEGEDEKYKKELLLRLAGSLLPRINEHSGEDGEPIVIKVQNYAERDNDTLPISTQTLSA